MTAPAKDDGMAADGHYEFNKASVYDAEQLAYLMTKKRPQGGWNFSYADLKIWKDLIGKGIEAPFVWLDPDSTAITPPSVFNMACENYVKRCIMEYFGIYCQVKLVNKTSHNEIQWIMAGVCPFHRIVHDHQNWAIINGREESVVICYRGDERGKPIRAFIHELPLYSPAGDNPKHYPVDIRG